MDKHAEFVQLKYRTVNHYKGGLAVMERNLADLYEEKSVVLGQIAEFEEIRDAIEKVLPRLEAATEPQDLVDVYEDMKPYLVKIMSTQ